MRARLHPKVFYLAVLCVAFGAVTATSWLFYAGGALVLVSVAPVWD